VKYVESTTKKEAEYGLKIRRELISVPKELKEADVIIFHDPYDVPILERVNKPSILYVHRAMRPLTFMFKTLMSLEEPYRRRICERDRKWVLEKIKEQYEKVDVLVCNSLFIKKQLKKWFGIEADGVLYPPINLNFFKSATSNPTRDYFLSVQRVHWQKRIDVQIDAFEGTNERLIIVGGRGDKEADEQLAELVKAYENVEFLGPVSDRKLVKLYSNAKATIQTGYYEDFGLVPIESLACGTPAIVVDEGGFKETIHSPYLGIRIKKPYVKNLRKAILNFDVSKYNPKVLRKEAEKYSFKKFKKELEKYVELAVERHALQR